MSQYRFKFIHVTDSDSLTSLDDETSKAFARVKPRTGIARPRPRSSVPFLTLANNQSPNELINEDPREAELPQTKRPN